MKKLFLLLILMIGGAAMLPAQNEDPVKVEKRMKEVREFKMKYLAQEMELTEAQKKKFFELYNEMCDSKKDCYKEAIRLKHQIKNDKGATEADYQKVTDAMNKANSDWSVLEKQFDEKFGAFLSQKQIYKMKEAENTYRSKVESMKHNRKKEAGKN